MVCAVHSVEELAAELGDLGFQNPTASESTAAFLRHAFFYEHKKHRGSVNRGLDNAEVSAPPPTEHGKGGLKETDARDMHVNNARDAYEALDILDPLDSNNEVQLMDAQAFLDLCLVEEGEDDGASTLTPSDVHRACTVLEGIQGVSCVDVMPPRMRVTYNPAVVGARELMVTIRHHHLSLRYRSCFKKQLYAKNIKTDGEPSGAHKGGSSVWKRIPYAWCCSVEGRRWRNTEKQIRKELLVTFLGIASSVLFFFVEAALVFSKSLTQFRGVLRFLDTCVSAVVLYKAGGRYKEATHRLYRGWVSWGGKVKLHSSGPLFFSSALLWPLGWTALLAPSCLAVVTYYSTGRMGIPPQSGYSHGPLESLADKQPDEVRNVFMNKAEKGLWEQNAVSDDGSFPASLGFEVLQILAGFLIGEWMAYVLQRGGTVGFGQSEPNVAGGVSNHRNASKTQVSPSLFRLILRPEELRLVGYRSSIKALRNVGSPKARTSNAAEDLRWMDLIPQVCGPSSLFHRSNGVALDVPEQLLQIGDIIVVMKNQYFPADGIVLERVKDNGGATFVVVQNPVFEPAGFCGSTSIPLAPGDIAFGGGINIGEPVVIKILHVGTAATHFQFNTLVRVITKWKAKREYPVSWSFREQFHAQQGKIMTALFQTQWLRVGGVLIWSAVVCVWAILLYWRDDGNGNDRLETLGRNGLGRVNHAVPAGHMSITMHIVLSVAGVVIRMLFCFVSPVLGLAVPLALRAAQTLAVAKRIHLKRPLETLCKLTTIKTVVLERTGVLTHGKPEFCGIAVIPKALVKIGLLDIPSPGVTPVASPGGSAVEGFPEFSLNVGEVLGCRGRNALTSDVERLIFTEPILEVSLRQSGVPEEPTPSVSDAVASLRSDAEFSKGTRVISPPSEMRPNIGSGEGERRAARMARRLGLRASFIPHRGTVRPPFAAQEDNVSREALAGRPVGAGGSCPSVRTLAPLDCGGRGGTGRSSYPESTSQSSPRRLSPEDIRIRKRYIGPYWERRLCDETAEEWERTAELTLVDGQSLQPAVKEVVSRMEGNWYSPSTSATMTTVRCSSHTQIRDKRSAHRPLEIAWIVNTSSPETHVDLETPVEVSRAALIVSPWTSRAPRVRNIDGTASLLMPQTKGATERAPSHWELLRVFWWLLWSACAVHDNPLLDALIAHVEELPAVQGPTEPAAAFVGLDGDLVCEIAGIQVSVSVIGGGQGRKSRRATGAARRVSGAAVVEGGSGSGYSFGDSFSSSVSSSGLSSLSLLSVLTGESKELRTASAEKEAEELEQLQRPCTFDDAARYKPSSWSWERRYATRNTMVELCELREAEIPERGNNSQIIWRPALGALPEYLTNSTGTEPRRKGCSTPTLGETSGVVPVGGTGRATTPPLFNYRGEHRSRSSCAILEKTGSVRSASPPVIRQIQTPPLQLSKDNDNLVERGRSEQPLGKLVQKPLRASDDASAPRRSALKLCLDDPEIKAASDGSPLVRLHHIFSPSSATNKMARKVSGSAGDPHLFQCRTPSLAAASESISLAEAVIIPSPRDVEQTTLRNEKKSDHTTAEHVTDAALETAPRAMETSTPTMLLSLMLRDERTGAEEKTLYSPRQERGGSSSKTPPTKGVPSPSRTNIGGSRRLNILDILAAQQVLGAGTSADISSTLRSLSITAKQLSDSVCVCQRPCHCHLGTTRTTGMVFGSEPMSLAVVVNTPLFGVLRVRDLESCIQRLPSSKHTC